MTFWGVLGKIRVSHGRFGGTLRKFGCHMDVLGDLGKIRVSDGRFRGTLGKVRCHMDVFGAPWENLGVTWTFWVDLGKISVSHARFGGTLGKLKWRPLEVPGDACLGMQGPKRPLRGSTRGGSYLLACTCPLKLFFYVVRCFH